MAPSFEGGGLSIPTSLSNYRGTDSREVLIHLVHQGVQVPDGIQRLAVLLAVHPPLLPQAGDLRGSYRAAPYLCSKVQLKGLFPSEPLPVLEPAKASRFCRAATIMLHQQPCRKSLAAVQSLNYSSRGLSTRHVTAFLRNKAEVRCDSHHVEEALALLPHSPAAPGPPPPGSRPCQTAWATRPGRRCGPCRHPPPALRQGRPLLRALPLRSFCWG